MIKIARIATVLTLFSLPVRADAIPGYTVTDLGVGEAQLGNGILVAPDGQTYAFPTTDNSVPFSQPLTSSLPPLPTPGIIYNNPAYVYIHYDNDGAFLNANGVYAGSYEYGVASHSLGAGSAAFVSERQPDGSFGPLINIWASPNNSFSGGIASQVLALNNLNQALVMGSAQTYIPGWHLILYDLNTRATTWISPALNGWWLTGTVALDDEGKIFLTARRYDDSNRLHSLLITPEPSNPSPVPEPTTLTALLVGIGGFATRARRRRKRR